MSNQTRIHIVGSGPRTGTTLLAEVMVTCFDIPHYCEHEASLLTRHPGEGIFLTKKPGEFLSVKWPLRFDKNLYVICLIRDPRDTIVSFHGTEPNNYWASLRFWNFFTKVFNSLVVSNRFIVIKYEDFTSHPDLTQDYLQRLVPGLVSKCKFSEYHLFAKPSGKSLKAMRILRPIEPKGIGNWKHHLPRIKHQTEHHGSISESLINFGYEKDSHWERLLIGIEALSGPTYSGENYSRYKIIKKYLIGYIYCVYRLFHK